MNIYETPDIAARIQGNPYVGRGIIVGKTEDASKAVALYFIMGRSENSRNRVFVQQGETVMIHPFDPAKVEDPSLIIYAPIRRFENHLIVTNGDQTDTVYNFLTAGKSFEAALDTRAFEPDAPNFTPRISAMLSFAEGDFTYKLNILKSADADGTACNRFTFTYAPTNGVGHFLHTYVTDGNPLPTFQGEPERIAIGNDVKAFADTVWQNLNADNRISLYMRSVELKTGKTTDYMINTHTK